MTDREKVITGLECCQSKSHCEECPYIYEGLCSIGTCTADLASDTLALLKEKEAVEPLTEFFIGKDYQPTCKACGFRPFVYIPTLEWMKERGFNFCPRCGKKVKWDADGA